MSEKTKEQLEQEVKAAHNKQTAKSQKANSEKSKKELAIMDANKTDVLWRNHKGEYFTNENLASLSISAEAKKSGKKLVKLERHVLQGKSESAE